MIKPAHRFSYATFPTLCGIFKLQSIFPYSILFRDSQGEPVALLREGGRKSKIGLWSMGSQTLLQGSAVPLLSRIEMSITGLPWYLMYSWVKILILYFSISTPIPGSEMISYILASH